MVLLIKFRFVERNLRILHEISIKLRQKNTMLPEPGRTQDGGFPSSKTGQIEDGEAKNGVPSSKTARNEDGKGAAAEERRRKIPRSPAAAGAFRMAQN